MVVSGGTTVTQLTDSVTATYTSTLTVTGRKSGNYCCVIANSRSTVVSPMLPVQGEYYLYLGYCRVGSCRDRVDVHAMIYYANTKISQKWATSII